MRKIGSNIYESFESIHEDFEKEYFSFKEIYFDDFSLLGNRIEDILFRDDTKLKVNFIRNLDTGNVFDENTGESTKAFQVSLDLDAYLDEDALISNNYKENLTKLIAYINNDILFNLFKNSVTKGFLNKNLNQ